KTVLSTVPPGTDATARGKRVIQLALPTFVEKKRQRVTWSSRVEIIDELTRDIAKPAAATFETTYNDLIRRLANLQQPTKSVTPSTASPRQVDSTAKPTIEAATPKETVGK